MNVFIKKLYNSSQIEIGSILTVDYQNLPSLKDDNSIQIINSLEDHVKTFIYTDNVELTFFSNTINNVISLIAIKGLDTFNNDNFTIEVNPFLI